MSVELISVLIAVLAIGATLAGLILTSNRGLRKDMREDIGQLRGDINDLRGRRVTGRALNAEDQVMVSGIVGQP